MMKHQIGKRITALWKGLLSQREKENLLADLEIHESDLKSDLEKSFTEDKEQEQVNLLSDPEYDAILRQVHAKIDVQEQKPRRIFQPWAAAAAILLLIGAAGVIFNYQNLKEPSASFAQANAQPTDTITVRNTTSQDRIARLKDGSVVTLSAGAQLAYARHYGESDRVLHLQGKATFEVAHDTARPFVVWTDKYSTTALGTVFMIDATSKQQIDIALLSGEIVVKKAAQAGRAMADQYLAAGDKLSIDRQNERFVFIPAKQIKPTSIPPTVAPEVIPVEPTLEFADAPLQSVFETIAVRKQVQISTTDLDLDGLTFTGEFLESESAAAMIRVICQMNNLHCEETTNGLIISHKNLINQTVPTEIKNQTTN